MNDERGSGLTLAIDTSGPLCAAGLFDGTTERARIVLDLGRGHAERVVGACEDALAAAGARWSDVGTIAVTVGPGSFTGVRAGVAAARGLALSLGVPAIGVTTLEAMAGPLPALDPYAVALDARRGQIYAQVFGADGTAITEPAVETPEAIAAGLPAAIRHVVGSGAPALAEALRGMGREAGVPVRDGRPMTDAQPDIRDVALCAMVAGASARPPAPLYLRGADAKLPGGIDPPGPSGAGAVPAMTPPPSRAM